jgi:serine/threonine protein phosphatase PrpC
MEHDRGAAPQQSMRARFHGDRAMTILVRAATDLGLRRQNNEDSYGCWLADDPDELARRGLLLAVADGMGGSKGGEVASRITIETLLHDYRSAAGTDVADNLRAAVTSANRLVYREGQAHPDLAGMGTTCTAAVLRGREITVAHVGDSRAYVVRGGRTRQLTHDHSLVGQMVRNRQLTAEQARTDPRRNVVTRSVGIDADLEVDAERIEEPLAHGDVVVLCTDGLHGVVRDDELGATVSDYDLEGACNRLVALARERGAPDNLTLILARIEVDGEQEPAISATHERLSRSNPTFTVLIVTGLMLLLLALGALGLLLLRMGPQTARQGAALEGRPTVRAS